MFDAYSLAAGILIGLSLAVPPGPVNAVIAAESVKGSYLNGIKVGLGAMTADSAYLIISLVGVTVLFTGDGVKFVVSLLGGTILAYMAVRILKDYKKGLKGDGKEKLRRPYLTGLTIGITNPAGILWWLTAGAAMITSFSFEGIAGFFLGLGLWISSFALALHFARKKAEWLYPVVTVASGIVLLFFGVLLAYNSYNIAISLLQAR